STQSLQVVAINIAAVLLPSLAKIQDEPQRLLSAFSRAAKVMTVLAVPACLLQAAVADPLIRLAFKDQWFGAIPLVQILSVGWLAFAVKLSADSLLKAQGRFTAYLWFMIVLAGLFLACVYVGARQAAAAGAAFGV